MKKIYLVAVALFLIGFWEFSFPQNSFSLSLLEAYQKAKEHDPEYLSALYESKASAYLPKESLAQLLPRLQAIYNRMRYDFTEAPYWYVDYTGKSLSIQLTQTLFDLPKFIDLKQNERKALSMEYKFLATRNALMIRVSEAYLDLVHALEFLRSVEEESKAIEENYKLIKALFQAGEATLVDLHDAEAKLSEVNYRLIDARNKVETAKNNLERMVGIKLEEINKLKEELKVEVVDLKEIERYLEQVALKNPLGLYYLVNSEVVKDEMNKNRASHLPTLNLIGTYSDTNSRDFIKEQNVKYYAIGIQVNIPIFAGGYYYYRTKELFERYKQAEQDYKKVLSDIVQNLKNSFLDLRASALKIDSAKAYLKSAETALNSTRIGYKSGIRTVVDLLNAFSNYYKAKSDLLQANVDYLKSKLRLLYWSGLLEEESLKELEVFFEKESRPKTKTMVQTSNSIIK